MGAAGAENSQKINTICTIFGLSENHFKEQLSVHLIRWISLVPHLRGDGINGIGSTKVFPYISVAYFSLLSQPLSNYCVKLDEQ